MYSIKLDETKHFTGSYALVGGDDGGINIPTLPPDMDKGVFYIWDYHDVTTTQQVPDIDEGSGLQKTDPETNEPLYKNETVTNSILDWIFDDEKYNQYLTNSLGIVKQAKINEFGNICQKNIAKGKDVTTSNGVEHFSFDPDKQDQSNINSAYNIAKTTGLSVIYHADGQPCRIFTVQEITDIFVSMNQYIAYYTTMTNMLNTWVRRCTTIEEIHAIEFTSALPEDLQALFDTNMAQAQLIINALTGTQA